MPFSLRVFRLSLALLTMALAACAGANQRTDRATNGTATTPSTNESFPGMPPGRAPLNQPVRVSMLLPLTGTDAALGVAMQNAAQLAITDLNEPQFELTFEDTRSTPAGAAAAAESAAQAGARLLLGPIRAEEVRATKASAMRHNLNVVAFSTDTNVASPGTYVMGIVPQDQARTMARYAAAQGLRRVLVIAPNDSYGQIVTQAFLGEAQRHGIALAGMITPQRDERTMSNALRPYFPTTAAPAIDGIFMPIRVEDAARVSRLLKSFPNGVNIPRLGTGLWDDADLLAWPDLAGALYAAPPPEARARFDQSYAQAFGNRPPRLASIGYDAAALAIVLARTTTAPTAPISTAALATPNGFAGIDGLFRFLPQGAVERSLAVIALYPGGRAIIAPAQNRFAVTP